MMQKIKNFDDIIEFLEQPNPTIITYLKKKKNFIEKWFDVYLNDLPEINANLQYLDVTKNLQNCPTWISDFEELIIKICDNCKHGYVIFCFQKCNMNRIYTVITGFIINSCNNRVTCLANHNFWGLK